MMDQKLVNDGALTAEQIRKHYEIEKESE